MEIAVVKKNIEKKLWRDILKKGDMSAENDSVEGRKDSKGTGVGRAGACSMEEALQDEMGIGRHKRA